VNGANGTSQRRATKVKTRLTLALIALTAIPVAAMAAEGEKLSCIKDFTYSSEFLAAYPNAPKACRDVIVKDGKKSVHFVGNVITVKGDQVTVAFENVAGDTVFGEGTYQHSPDARVMVEGKEVKYSSLRPGDKLDVYVGENVAGLYSAPGAATGTELKLVKRTPAN
jgi:hypothetical protein